MRGLDLVIGYIIGNKTARTWCINNLKKASLIVDKEIKKSPLGKLVSAITTPETKESQSENKEKENDRSKNQNS